MMSKQATPESADAAFRELVQRHRAQLIRFGMRRLQNREVVDELVSDTLLAAWTHFAERPSVDEELFWLYGIANRVYSNLLRGQHRRQKLYRRLQSEAPSAVPCWERDSVGIDAMLDEIDSLRAEDREALQLAYWECLSHREISIVLDCSENAVSLRLSRARRRIRERLDSRRVREGAQ